MNTDSHKLVNEASCIDLIVIKISFVGHMVHSEKGRLVMMNDRSPPQMCRRLKYMPQSLSLLHELAVTIQSTRPVSQKF